MTWTILAFYLFHPSDSYVTGEFKTHKHCITAIKVAHKPEMEPDVWQCVEVDSKAIKNYKLNYWSN